MPVLIGVAVLVLILAGGGGAYAALHSSHHHHPRAVAQASAAGSSTTTRSTTSTTTVGDTQSTPTTPASSSTTTTSTTTTRAKPKLPPGACVDGSTGVQLKNGFNLSCSFARSIVAKLTAYYRHGSTLQSGAASFEVRSPDTHLTYSVTCSLSGSNVVCHNNQSADPDNGHGNNDVIFPRSLVQ